MKTLLKKILLFYLPFLIAFPILDARLGQIPNYFAQKRQFIETQLDEIEILTMGSSQGNSINPQFLSARAFNLSNDSQDLYYDWRLIEKYIQRMPNLRLVVLPISYFSLEYRIDRSQSNWRTYFYELLWDIPPQPDDTKLQAGFYSYIAAYGWNEVQNYLQNGFQSRMVDKMMPDGWRDTPTIELEESAEKELQARQSTIKPDQGIMHREAVPGNITWTQRIIDLCRTRNVNVVIITTPVHHYYSDNIDPFAFQLMQEEIARLVRSNGLSYFNFFTDDRFSASDFYNRDHLNNQGCEKFSQIMDAEIIQPLLSNQ